MDVLSGCPLKMSSELKKYTFPDFDFSNNLIRPGSNSSEMFIMIVSVRVIELSSDSSGLRVKQTVLFKNIQTCKRFQVCSFFKLELRQFMNELVFK
mgnify:CR=1 FL=1